MTKTPRTLSIALAATVALLAAPAPALAEYLVPEGNSAVTQYTEGFPTAGGEKKTEGTGEKKPVTPAKAIGAANAKKLEDHGPDGAAVAEVAAETAPADVPVTTAPSGDSGDSDPVEAQPPKHRGGDRGGDSAKDEPAKKDSKQDREDSGVAVAPAQGGEGPGGSSGLGEIAGAATGSSSGQLGLLLPLVILAAIAWAFAFLWRQRKQPDSTATAKP